MVETVLSRMISDLKSVPQCAHASAHRTDTQTGLGFKEVALTVDVPAEEMMFHQHVLNAFLQRPLLLLLEKIMWK